MRGGGGKGGGEGGVGNIFKYFTARRKRSPRLLKKRFYRAKAPVIYIGDSLMRGAGPTNFRVCHFDWRALDTSAARGCGPSPKSRSVRQNRSRKRFHFGRARVILTS